MDWAVSLTWVSLLGCGASSGVLAAGKNYPQASASSPPLGRVMKDQLSGWDDESEEVRAEYLALSEKYQQLRRGKMSEEEQDEFFKSCEVGESLRPPHGFCPALAKLIAPREKRRRALERAEKRKRTQELRAAFKKNDLQKLSAFSEGELSLALRLLDEPKKLQVWAKMVLEDSACSGAALPSALGIKLEKYFPDPEFKQASRELYLKAIRCASEEGSSVLAFYRLGLLSVWENEINQARVYLGRVIAERSNPQAQDYRLRALYWTSVLAKQQKDRAAEKEHRELLLKEYPLSLHGLLLSTDNLFGDLPMVSRREPGVSMRTKVDPPLNAAILAAEALQVQGQFERSIEVLEPVLESVASKELSFRLYVAVLLLRGGDSIKKFGVMAQIFRENPQLISTATLELLYPLRRFELIQNQLTASKLDPYLVLSLIRQESAFNEKARSAAGAVGLMQLLPRTARLFERVSKHQLLDPRTNVRVGTKFFERLVNRFGGDVELALAAYNAGPERVDEWRRRYPIENRLLFLDLIPFKETRDYVASIARNYYWYLRLYSSEQLGDRLRNRIVAVESNGAVLKIFGMPQAGQLGFFGSGI